MKRRTWITIAVVAALLAAIGGGYWYSIVTRSLDVTTAPVTVQKLTVTVSASGKVEATRTRGVFPVSAGTLASVKVEDGDTVKAGELLGVLDGRPLRIAVTQAKATLAAARAQLDAVERGVPTALERKAASVAVKASKSSLRTARKNYHEYKELFEATPEPDQEAMESTLRDLRSAKKQAYAALVAAEATVSRLNVNGRVGLSRTAAAQAVLAAGEALALAEDNAGHLDLTAPIGGVVTLNGTVEKGAAVSPGVAPFTVVDQHQMSFTATVNEIDIAGVRKGQPSTISLDAFLDRSFQGKVTRVRSTAVETATGGIAFPVRISIGAGDARLFEGMSGSADIEVTSVPNALTVPIEAVLTEGTARTVFVLGADGKAHKTPVNVGVANDTTVQILNGLAAGDRVITSQLTALTDGAAVKSL